MKCVGIVLIAIFGPLGLHAQSPNPHIPVDWRAGAASVVITPDTNMWMAGYAARNKPSEGKAQDLFAKALALEDKDGARFVIVTMDLIGVPRSLRNNLERRAALAHQLRPEQLLLNASHTHCGPEFRSGRTPADDGEFKPSALAERYGAQLEEKVFRLIGEALSNLAPARLSYCHARCGFAMNRRLPGNGTFRNSPYADGPVDHDVPVLKVESVDGKELRAVLFGYACHNTTLSFYQWCGDYAGFAQEYLQAAHPGMEAMFLTGCGGDQNPYPRGTLELAQQHGRTLATAVEAALIANAKTVSGPLRAAYAEIDLPYAAAPSRQEFERRLKSKDSDEARHAKRMLDRLEAQGGLPEAYSYPIQIVHFGEGLILIALGGEVVVDYPLRLKKELAGAAVWISGYCNDVMAYIPSERVLHEGGYEGGGAMRFSATHPGPWARGIEERIVAKVHELNRRLAQSRGASATVSRAGGPVPLIVTPRRNHLRSGSEPEWDEFGGEKELPRRLDLHFSAQPNTSEATLFIWQDDVKKEWMVELNGTRIGQLFLMEAPVVHTIAIAKGMLGEGTNTLSILPPRDNDDIFVGPVHLDSRPPNHAVSEAELLVRVLDRTTRQPLPSRLTIVDQSGALVPLRSTNQLLAVRPGVTYTASGEAALRIPAGNYTVYATRGFEYGCATGQVALARGGAESLDLLLAREVDTAGWISCDTHTHTFTFSRHGDATLQERVIALAGEGIELPIATDHNILTDYAEAAAATGVERHLTPVIGVEVTTRQAHFNVFPVLAGSRVPDFRINDWPTLLRSIRETPGAEVVILNHPHNIHNEFRPFARTNFNPVTAQSLQFLHFDFDGIELLNSSAQQSEMMLVYRDWFALLNAGHRIVGVGSSDSHDVSRYIVGQGRTYIRVADDDPGNIDVAAACRALRGGRALVSMGLLTTLTVDRQFEVGDLATNLNGWLDVEVRVLSPSWTKVDTVTLFANGTPIRQQKQEPALSSKVVAQWRLPKPGHDVWLVAMATGPGVDAPYWKVPRPYQPRSTTWKADVAGSTNPVWIDADGDGAFSCSREYAERLVNRSGTNPTQLLPVLAGYDQSVAAHAASLCHKAGENLRSDSFSAALDLAAPAVQEGFRHFLATMPLP